MASDGTRMDLKICEGCGSLFLRTIGEAGEAGVYCRRCEAGAFKPRPEAPLRLSQRTGRPPKWRSL